MSGAPAEGIDISIICRTCSGFSSRVLAIREARSDNGQRARPGYITRKASKALSGEAHAKGTAEVLSGQRVPPLPLPPLLTPMPGCWARLISIEGCAGCEVEPLGAPDTPTPVEAGGVTTELLPVMPVLPRADGRTRTRRTRRLGVGHRDHGSHAHKGSSKGLDHFDSSKGSTPGVAVVANCLREAFRSGEGRSLIGHQCHDLVVASDRLSDLDLLGASAQRYAQNC